MGMASRERERLRLVVADCVRRGPIASDDGAFREVARRDLETVAAELDGLAVDGVDGTGTPCVLIYCDRGLWLASFDEQYADEGREGWGAPDVAGAVHVAWHGKPRDAVVRATAPARWEERSAGLTTITVEAPALPGGRVELFLDRDTESWRAATFRAISDAVSRP